LVVSEKEKEKEKVSLFSLKLFLWKMFLQRWYLCMSNRKKESWRLLIIDYWLLIMDYWLLIIDYGLWIIDYGLWIISVTDRAQTGLKNSETD
jgi:hypothetical protein